jgi:hypothetical protein
MNQAAAIYTRVPSDRQKESDTIASQTAALVEYAKAQGYAVPPEWILRSVSRRGCLPTAQGCAVQESSRPVRLFGQIRVGPNHLLAGRWNTDASRD